MRLPHETMEGAILAGIALASVLFVVVRLLLHSAGG